MQFVRTFNNIMTLQAPLVIDELASFQWQLHEWRIIIIRTMVIYILFFENSISTSMSMALAWVIVGVWHFCHSKKTGNSWNEVKMGQHWIEFSHFCAYLQWILQHVNSIYRKISRLWIRHDNMASMHIAYWTIASWMIKTHLIIISYFLTFSKQFRIAQNFIILTSIYWSCFQLFFHFYCGLYWIFGFFFFKSVTLSCVWIL